MAGGQALASLERVARKLGSNVARARRRREIPGLWFFTDPVRTPDPLAVAAHLPAGSVVVYRAFGAKDADLTAIALRRITRARGLLLLIGADEALAARVGADGLHLPERLAHRIGRVSRAHPGWLVSVAAHSRAALARTGEADAVVISAVFPSRSPSASRALGPLRFAALVRSSRAPVIALGGVNNKNAPRLLSTGAAGLAAIDGLSASD
jgi:thiamine-phosphate pyrophosphorylase